MKNRIIASVIFSAILLAAVSCGDQADDQGAVSDTQPVSTAETEAPIQIFSDSLPERDYNGENYTVLAAAEQWAKKYHAEEQTGDIIEDAVFTRNQAIEERFNVKLVYDFVDGYTAGKETVQQRLYNAVMAGDATYDLFAGDSYYIAGQIMDGIFANLAEMEYLDFSRPYWFRYNNPNLRCRR